MEEKKSISPPASMKSLGRFWDSLKVGCQPAHQVHEAYVGGKKRRDDSMIVSGSP